jgi:ribose transport system permease protein
MSISSSGKTEIVGETGAGADARSSGAVPSPAGSLWRLDHHWLRQGTHTLGLAFAVVAFGICFTLLNPYLGHLSNLGNIVSQSTILVIMAFGMTFAIVAGEIGLSVGSAFALTSMIFGLLLQGGAGVLTAAILAVLVSAGLGAINGLLNLMFNVPTIIIGLFDDGP